ncbi:MAG: hypothetical protein H8E15_08200 [Planctomycetes bacterium]|nr:hypothetical protein [Planctomycetota bacterium]
MLNARPNGRFSWNYKFFDGDALVAELEIPRFRSQGKLILQDDIFEIGREGILSGDFFLTEEGGEVVASARKRGFILRSYEVKIGQSRYVLAPGSWFTRKFELLKGSKVIGRIQPEGFLNRRAEILLPTDMPLQIQAYLTWLVVIVWKRQRRSN